MKQWKKVKLYILTHCFYKIILLLKILNFVCKKLFSLEVIYLFSSFYDINFCNIYT